MPRRQGTQCLQLRLQHLHDTRNQHKLFHVSMSFSILAASSSTAGQASVRADAHDGFAYLQLAGGGETLEKDG